MYIFSTWAIFVYGLYTPYLCMGCIHRYIQSLKMMKIYAMKVLTLKTIAVEEVSTISKSITFEKCFTR